MHPDATEILERIEDNRYWYNAQVPKNEQERKPGEQSSSGREKRVSWQGTRKEAIDQSEPETSGDGKFCESTDSPPIFRCNLTNSLVFSLRAAFEFLLFYPKYFVDFIIQEFYFEVEQSFLKQ